MAFKFMNKAGRLYQVVEAEKRGDKCYEGKKGWYYHLLDDDYGIDEATVSGPYRTYADADNMAVLDGTHGDVL